MGLNEDGELFFASRLVWDKNMILERCYNDGKRFGNKTLFLELVAMILPFLTIPSKLCNQHIVLETDNLGCVFGWEKKASKDDILSSILFRALHFISFRLCSIIHVHHTPRKSSWESVLADRLTRQSSMVVADERLLRSFEIIPLPPFFLS